MIFKKTHNPPPVDFDVEGPGPIDCGLNNSPIHQIMIFCEKS